ncbi:hypothetical protein ACTWPT_54880 [Nonomuraea sp. 3N208]|uniref:hypothetical protein n=1 Tax=Nonomuraea sp. 3N208 TaxID=3457421 RepID=UPI003FCF0435
MGDLPGGAAVAGGRVGQHRAGVPGALFQVVVGRPAGASAQLAQRLGRVGQRAVPGDRLFGPGHRRPVLFAEVGSGYGGYNPDHEFFGYRQSI